MLTAANTALPLPDDPLAQLWHAATLVREHRGDGHVAAGLDGCEVLVLRAGTNLPRSELQPYRGWTNGEWAAAAERLTGRGLLTSAGTTAERGRQALREIEQATNRAAARPWRDAGAAIPDRLIPLLTPLARACATALRFPNPIGLPAPDWA